MAQGPSDTILVAIRIALRIRESKVRNLDPPDRRRFVLSECISCLHLEHRQSARYFAHQFHLTNREVLDSVAN